MNSEQIGNLATFLIGLDKLERETGIRISGDPIGIYTDDDDSTLLGYVKLDPGIEAQLVDVFAR